MINSQQSSSFRQLHVVSALFVSILVISNIASSAKIVDLGISLFSIPLVFDGGTLLFPFVYVLGDVITEVYGFKTARQVIWTGFAVMVLAALFFLLLGILPPESLWQNETGSAAYNAVLGGMSRGGIVLASLAAYLAGELSNAFVLSGIKIKTKGRPILGKLWVRTIGSTLVGELLDTAVFVLAACVFGVFMWEIALSLIITNYILKCAIEIVFTPLTYKACRLLKEKENADMYDFR